MGNPNLQKAINYIAKQFLCNVPIKSIKWNNALKYLPYDSQETLLNKTVNSELVLKYQIDVNYQKAFLKYLMENLTNVDIHDEIYSAYGRLVALPANSESFKHYDIEKSGNRVILKENVNMISDGTTGLRTWQASLALSEWALQNEQSLRNKAILELGSGMGLTGLTIAKECSPSLIYFSDCHPTVLENLRNNVALNMTDIPTYTKISPTIIEEPEGARKKIIDRCLYSNLGNPSLFVVDLPWEDIDQIECVNLGQIDKVLAADVVYDSELFCPLIKALESLSRFCSVEEFIFACTERNPKTLEAFVTKVRESSFIVEELPIPEQKNFMWPTDTSIKILRFTTICDDN